MYIKSRCQGSGASKQKVLGNRILQRVPHSCFFESFPAKPARIALHAGMAGGIRIVTTMGEAEVDAQLRSKFHDLGFRHANQRNMNFQAGAALDACLGGEIGHALISLDVFEAAIGIAGVIERIHSNEDAGRAEYLRPRERKRKKDGVARGHIGDRNTATHLREFAVFGHFDVAGERRATENPEIDVRGQMLDSAETAGDATGRFEFHAMALTVVERKSIACKAILPGHGEHGRRIETATEEANRFGTAAHFGSFKASRNPRTGNTDSAIKAVCMENRSEIQPVSGMKTRPAVPQAKPIISAETVPVCEGASSCAMTTFTGLVQSRIIPPAAKAALEIQPPVNRNTIRKGTEPIIEAIMTRRPPKRSAR